MNRHPAAGGDAAACGDARLAVSLAKIVHYSIVDIPGGSGRGSGSAPWCRGAAARTRARSLYIVDHGQGPGRV